MSINTDTYGYIEYVGDLLSKFYPSTVIYSDANNVPIIVEWLDENDSGDDILISYKVSVDALSDYLNGLLDHLELVKLAEGGAYCVYINEISNSPSEVLGFENLDKSTLPESDSFFKVEDSVNYNEIRSRFSISSLETLNDGLSLDQVSDSHPEINGFFRLHVNESSRVGFGTIDTKVLGELLLSFEDLYHSTASDVFTKNNRGENLSTDDHMAFLNSTKTEVFIQEAASYSLYIKAKHAYRYSDDGNNSDYQFITDEIFDKLNTLILKSRDVASLKEIHSSYDSKVFKSLKGFAETVMSNRLVVDFDYHNSGSNFNFGDRIIPRDAHDIFMSVGNNKVVDKEEFEVQGIFSKLNTDTGHFRFTSDRDLSFSGYIGLRLYDSIRSLNFNTRYEVRIERTRTEYLGSLRVSYSSIMTSCTPV